MADFNKVKQDIKDDIRPNGVGEITGQTMQDTLVEIVELEEQAYNELNSEIETSKREASQEIAKTNTRLATAEKNISDNKTETNLKFAEVNEALENKAQVDERYPKLTAGFADNLVGRGEATPEEFVFQPTANDVSVQDGTARIRSIKGNSVVWNQMSTMPNITPNILADCFEIFSIPTEAKNHRYFIAFTDPNLCANSIRIVGRSEADVYKEYTIPYTSHAEAIFNISPHNGSIYVRAIANDGVTKGQFDDLLFVDLTKAFPNDWQNINTVDDFYARIPSGVDIHAYNEGEIISMHTEAIKTVGFNAWDEQWEVGALSGNDGTLVDNGGAIRSSGFIQVVAGSVYNIQCPTQVILCAYDDKYQYIEWLLWGGNTSQFTIPHNCKYIKFCTYGNIYGNTYNHDICINLSHTGVENGKYKPYTPFTRELPIIKKYFPEGMRKAGSVADSIEWDSTKQKWVAVQRVGERAYASGDESDATVLTNNTTTLYELAEPIVTEIEDIPELDYLVWDFGTEEALSSAPSAPFSADIIYQFNAVDRIRENTLRVQALENIIAQLQAQMASMTAQVTNEEI